MTSVPVWDLHLPFWEPPLKFVGSPADRSLVKNFVVTIQQTNGLLRTVELRAESVAHACALAMETWAAKNVFGVVQR